ncbi:hypothetical protein FQZ97_1163120 [compost metagenome]
MLQPPSFTGPRFTRRCVSAAQSMFCTCTVMPMARSFPAVTCVKAEITGLSTGLRITTGVPSYLASRRAWRAASRPGAFMAALPASLDKGVPQGKME